MSVQINVIYKKSDHMVIQRMSSRIEVLKFAVALLMRKPMFFNQEHEGFLS